MHGLITTFPLGKQSETNTVQMHSKDGTHTYIYSQSGHEFMHQPIWPTFINVVEKEGSLK